MRYHLSPTYVRCLKGIGDAGRLRAIDDAVVGLVRALESSLPAPRGLGLKKLRGPLWEVRSTLADRVVFSWEADLVVLRLAGSHDDVKRLLRVG